MYGMWADHISLLCGGGGVSPNQAHKTDSAAVDLAGATPHCCGCLASVAVAISSSSSSIPIILHST